MTSNLDEEITNIVAKMDDQQNEQTPLGDIQDIYVLIVRETEAGEEDQTQVVESAPVTSQKISFIPAYAMCSFYLFLIVSCIAFQVYEVFNPPIATVTIIPKSQQVTLSGTLQLGRVLQPITISQSQTVATTGRGHQDARAATGELIYYNGSFTPQTVDAGTLYSGSDGIQVMTNETVTIPAATPGNPPQFGYAAIGATAIQIGSRGNIPAGDISITGTTLQVSNSQFHNGQDQRDYQTVTRSDVTNAAAPFKSSLNISMQGALTAQTKQDETIITLPCSPTVRPNHQVGDEAIQVKVTVSETCSAAAYNSQLLEEKARALLTSQVYKKLAGYSQFGDIQVSVKQASTTHTLVFLSFKATGMWVYGLSQQSQQKITYMIAGKSRDKALQILAAMPGIERASISFHGFTDERRLPKSTGNIHIILLVL